MTNSRLGLRREDGQVLTYMSASLEMDGYKEGEDMEINGVHYTVIEQHEYVSVGDKLRELADEADKGYPATLDEIATRVHSNAVKKGFWSSDMHYYEVPAKLMLVVSKLSEALEEDRKRVVGEMVRPEFEEEIADALIRLFDLAGGLGLHLDKAVHEKMVKNEQREYLHGKRY